MADERLRAEIDRVGASYGKVGAARYIQEAEVGGGEVWLLGPPHERPRSRWSGVQADALGALAGVPDGAGPDAVWEALGAAR